MAPTPEGSGFDAVAVTEADLKDSGPEEIEVESFHDDPANDVDADQNMSGTDSGPARELREQAPQERARDGTYAPKSNIPAKTPRETDEQEIRRILGEESVKSDEAPNPKKVDKAAEKGKDPKALKDPAETESGETTKKGDIEKAPEKLSRKVRADAENALLLDKWTKPEIAQLSDAALKTAAAKATERHAETNRVLEAAKQTAKNGTTDPATRKAATTDAPDADDDGDKLIAQIVNESFAAYDEKDPEVGVQNKAFKDGMTAHTKRMLTEVRGDLKTGFAEVRDHLLAEFTKALTNDMEALRFEQAMPTLKGRYGQQLKDRASLDQLRGAVKTISGDHSTYAEKLMAAGNQLWGETLLSGQDERQIKIAAAKRNGSADVSSRNPVTKPDNDEMSLIGRLVKAGPGQRED